LEADLPEVNHENPGAFQDALRLFLRSPQTKLVRHICTALMKDPGYVLRNRRSIETIVHTVLATQGIDAARALHGTSVFALLRLAGRRLGIRIQEDRWTLYQG
jgi:hypothetical protein